MTIDIEQITALTMQARETKIKLREAKESLSSLHSRYEEADRVIAALRERVREVEQEKRDAIKHTENLYQDEVQKMNDILNEAADDASLCDQYEAALEEVNRNCTLIELKGRPKDWDVFVQLQVSVTAVTEDEADGIAEAIASHMNSDTISGNYGEYPVYADAETSRTRRAD